MTITKYKMQRGFHLDIYLGNDGMDSCDDIAEALLSVVNRLRAGKDSGKIHDVNGNLVGGFTITESRY